MQPDFHRETTCYLAIKASFSPEQAGLIAWANQFVDDNNVAGLYKMRTACKMTDDWYDRTVQRVVIIPFHFMPGDSNGWMVTRYNRRVRLLLEESLGDLVRLGITLHTFQDTFAHEFFTGWAEKHNECATWEKMWRIITPNVGHADMGYQPDTMFLEWWDPRRGIMVDNKKRALVAAKETYRWLCKAKSLGFDDAVWSAMAAELRKIFILRDYKERKKRLRGLAGMTVDEDYYRPFEDKFMMAAAQHQARGLELCADLLKKKGGTPLI